jgi:general secretion pathway protein C
VLVEPRRRDASAILARNVFDSTRGPIVNSPPQAPGPCADGLQLVATVATRAEGWSLAAIRVGGTTVLYREGQPLGMHRVSRIGWGHALLESAGGVTCHLAMFGGARPDASRRSAGAPESGIDRVGPSEFNVDRRLVQRVLDDPTPLLTTRVMPYSEDGRLVGVRLLGIRREDLLGRLGFENGDVLRSVNGLDVASPERALDALQHLLTASHVTVRLGRRGSMVVLDYDLR